MIQVGADDQIELDIDALDKTTLWKLYLFVKKHTLAASNEFGSGGAMMLKGIFFVIMLGSSSGSSGSEGEDSGSDDDQ